MDLIDYLDQGRLENAEREANAQSEGIQRPWLARPVASFIKKMFTKFKDSGESADKKHRNISDVSRNKQTRERSRMSVKIAYLAVICNCMPRCVHYTQERPGVELRMVTCHPLSKKARTGTRCHTPWMLKERKTEHVIQWRTTHLEQEVFTVF